VSVIFKWGPIDANYAKKKSLKKFIFQQVAKTVRLFYDILRTNIILRIKLHISSDNIDTTYLTKKNMIKRYGIEIQLV